MLHELVLILQRPFQLLETSFEFLHHCFSPLACLDYNACYSRDHIQPGVLASFEPERTDELLATIERPGCLVFGSAYFVHADLTIFLAPCARRMAPIAFDLPLFAQLTTHAGGLRKALPLARTAVFAAIVRL